MATQSVHKRKPSVATSKTKDPNAPRRGPGRPRKDPGEVKRQVAFFLTDEERRMLKEMALLWGCTASQFLANLIRDNYKSKRYMKGFNQLSQDERAELVSQRQTTQFITSRREQTAMQRNLDRRMGMDRSLTNVMVIAAPLAVTHSAVRSVAPQDGINVPGIYCKNLGDVWIVPYGQLYRISVVEIIQYPCYASVLDYFAGKRIAPGLLSDFIARQHDFKLSSMGEKAVQERLAKVYGTIRYPVKESFELKRRERMIAESQQTMAQMLAELSPEARSTLDHISQNAAHEAEAYARTAQPIPDEPPAPMPEPVTPKSQSEAVHQDLSAEAAAIIPEPEVPASSTVPAEDTAQPEDAAQAADTVQPEDAGQAGDTVRPEDSVQPTYSAAPTEDIAQPEDAVQADDAVQAEDSAQPEDSVHPEGNTPQSANSAAQAEDSMQPAADNAAISDVSELPEDNLASAAPQAHAQREATAGASTEYSMPKREMRPERSSAKTVLPQAEAESEVPPAQPETQEPAQSRAGAAVAERARSRLLRRRLVLRQRQQLEVVLGQEQDPEVPSAPFLAEPTADDAPS